MFITLIGCPKAKEDFVPNNGPKPAFVCTKPKTGFWHLKAVFVSQKPSFVNLKASFVNKI